MPSYLLRIITGMEYHDINLTGSIFCLNARESEPPLQSGQCHHRLLNCHFFPASANPDSWHCKHPPHLQLPPPDGHVVLIVLLPATCLRPHHRSVRLGHLLVQLLLDGLQSSEIDCIGKPTVLIFFWFEPEYCLQIFLHFHNILSVLLKVIVGLGLLC